MKTIFGLLLILAFGVFPGPVFSMQETPPAADSTDKEEKKDLPLEATRSLAFTTSEGSWMSLDLSPDGQTIIFDLMGDLYTLPIDGGQAVALTTGMAFDAQPRFSPDGAKVLFVSDRDGGENLWTIDLESKEAKQLTKGKTSRYESPIWTPDGRYVVASKGEGRFGPTKLWMAHIDGGSGATLIKEPESLRTLGFYNYYANHT
jgi:Tol biopolymer transport system component